MLGFSASNALTEMPLDCEILQQVSPPMIVTELEQLDATDTELDGEELMAATL